MKHQGKGYTIEIADVKSSDKPQRMMPPIKVSIQTFFLPKEEPLNERKSDDWDDNSCPYCECELCECGLCHLCNAADEFADSIFSDEDE